MINRGGEKISPLEVDAALLGHPAVAEAVCFGVPHEMYGEAVQAAVVVSVDTDEDAIRAYCGEHLAGFKVPDRVHIIDTMPRTATAARFSVGTSPRCLGSKSGYAASSCNAVALLNTSPSSPASTRTASPAM